jgi:hypothetical protein
VEYGVTGTLWSLGWVGPYRLTTLRDGDGGTWVCVADCRSE